MELNLGRDTEKNREGFYRYANQKRKVKENLAPQKQRWKTVNNSLSLHLATPLPTSLELFAAE